MKCQEIKYELPDYINHNLDRETQDTIEKHIQSCDSCRREIEILNSVKSVLDKTSISEPGEKYFINFLPRLISKMSALKASPRIPFWVTKFALPFSSLTIVAVLMILIFRTNQDTNDQIYSNSTFIQIDTVEVNHDIISAVPIPGEQIFLIEDQLQTIHQKATEKLNESLIASNDENIYNSENVPILIDNLSDEEFSKVYQYMSSKPIKH